MVVVLLLLLATCRGGASSGGSRNSSSRLSGGGSGTRYTNPVVAARCGSVPAGLWGQLGCEAPDPGVARLPASGSSAGRWVALTTTVDANETFARHVSSDLAAWEPDGHIWNRTTRPSWGTANWFAPELHQHGELWILVFSATWSGKQAIGAAFAASPDGPFVDAGAPIAVSQNNTNDPTLVHAPGEFILKKWMILC